MIATHYVVVAWPGYGTLEQTTRIPWSFEDEEFRRFVADLTVREIPWTWKMVHEEKLEN